MVRMDEEEKQKWLEAGKITRKALEHGKKKISPDKTLLEVAEAVENKINEQGAETAFPVNLSLNEEAAHYTPEAEDDRKFGESIVKLDVGAQVDGYIGDCARTIDLTNENEELVKASEEALENAIEMVEPGAKTREIGAKIEETIESHGFKLKAGLKELVQKEVFTTYPVLKDKDLVSQTENTVVVTEDGCEITTKL